MDELSVLAHKFADLFDPDALFILIQMDHHVQLIARSAVAAIDVGEVLERFGGGGHARAAAAVVTDKDLSQVREDVIALLPKMIKPETKTADVMSRPVEVLSETASLAEARAVFDLVPHGALPVVDERGVIAGMLLREDLMKAARRRRVPGGVGSLMRRQFVFVSPRTSLHQVQQVLLDFNLDYLPVVENGVLQGMVVKEDLLKVWPGRAGQVRPEAELIRRIESALPSFLLRAVWRAAEIAGKLVGHLLAGLP